MTGNPVPESDFLNQLHANIEQNLSNEQFGVSELAELMHMSRSNLLRKVKKETDLSVAQLISQARLHKAMELLRSSSMNVSEVSEAVGFNSVSYFIKCFREHYGFPPGEAGKRQVVTDSPSLETEKAVRTGVGKQRALILSVTAVMIVAAIVLVWYLRNDSNPIAEQKSIAVLPFKNESTDSSNVYLINGLMESTLNNLHHIRELKVVSRTTAEKYRHSNKSIPEMARELEVEYFVEGSGQKIGDQILLNIQLIEGATDKHLWSKQYRREAKDIFSLQQEIASNIASEIKVVIAPDEKRKIEKIPTQNLEAYDAYLKGREMLYTGGTDQLLKGLRHLNRAIQLDDQFALAYGNAVIAYFYLDIFQFRQVYQDTIAAFSDKALLLDPTLPESMIARGLYYMHRKENDKAVPYLEKALEKNPSSGLAIHFLSEYYNIHNPNTKKYLRYALMGVEIEKGSTDSSTLSFKYLQVANALVQSGFFDDAKRYMNQALAYNPRNYFAYLDIFIDYATTTDTRIAKQRLLKELAKDSTRFDLLEQTANMCYFREEYDEAYQYYKRFNQVRVAMDLDILRNENLNIGITYGKMGLKKESEEYIRDFKDYADHDKTIYKHLHLSMYYCCKGDHAKALEHFRLFSKEDGFQYWVLLIETDPVSKTIRDNPEFRAILQQLKQKFWQTHAALKKEYVF